MVCTMVFNIEDLEVFKVVFAKKIVKPSFHEETSMAYNLNSNKRLSLYCTNSSSVISVQTYLLLYLLIVYIYRHFII
jgi:hypothetical protein